jgi:hypothetical protein
MTTRVKVLLVVFVLVVTASSHAETKMRPARLSDLSTAWLGGSPGFAHQYVRLDLVEDGTGFMVVQNMPDHDPSAYRVTFTTLAEYAVSFALQPIDPEAEPIYLRGQATARRLELEIGGAGTLKWSRKLFLEHEAAVLARIAAVQARAKALRAPK